MTAIVLTQEFMASRDRFQRTLMISLIVHVILFAWLLLRQNISPVPEGIVEISWLDPSPTMAPPPAVPVQAKPEPVVTPKPVTPSVSEEKFVRREEPAPVEPTPQDLAANKDMVKERLSTLTSSSLPTSALVPESHASSSLMKSAPVESADPGLKAPAVDLKRAETTATKPAALKRGPVKSERPTPTLATVPREKPAAAAAMPDMDSVARRTLDGAELSGEVANRPVVEHSMPVYPEWAKSQAVEATVSLYFVVLPDGRVKENIQIQKTAGFSDFDRSAVAALSAWRFQALAGSAAHEQWGTITFRFRLRD